MPSIMLPRARWVIGRIIIGLFSFVGRIADDRVDPVCTSRVMRRL